MRFAMLGSGAVGGYFGARLARAGYDVTFIARGSHLDAIRSGGLEVRSPALGGFTVRAQAESDPARVGPVDVVVVAVKAYDNDSAYPLIQPLLGPETAVLTLQNGVDNVDQLARIVGPERVLGGTTYVATAVEAPGLIVQTGVHRSIIFGEVFGIKLEFDKIEHVRCIDVVSVLGSTWYKAKDEYELETLKMELTHSYANIYGLDNIKVGEWFNYRCEDGGDYRDTITFLTLPEFEKEVSDLMKSLNVIKSLEG